MFSAEEHLIWDAKLVHCVRRKQDGPKYACVQFKLYALCWHNFVVFWPEFAQQRGLTKTKNFPPVVSPRLSVSEHLVCLLQLAVALDPALHYFCLLFFDNFCRMSCLLNSFRESNSNNELALPIYS